MLGLNLLSLIVSLLALAAPAQGLLRSQVEDEVASARADPSKAFSAWVHQNGRVYATDEERAHRYSTWLDNLEYIENYNSEHTTNWLGIGPFMDLSDDEFWKQMHGG